MSPRNAALCLIGAMALTGANLHLGKALVNHVPIYLFALYRFVVCGSVLALLVRREDGALLSKMSRSQIRDVVLMALFGMVGFMVFMLEGLRRTSAVDAGVITATIPAIVAILGVLFLRDRLSARQVFSIALAVLGIAIVQVAGAQEGMRSMLGNVLVSAAVVCEASFVIFGKRLAVTYRPIRLSLAANVAGAILIAPLAASDLAGFSPSSLSPLQWALATWYVLVAGVFSLLLWYRGLPHVETSTVGLATTAMPITALAISALLLGNVLTAPQLAGAALVIAAMVVAATGKSA